MTNIQILVIKNEIIRIPCCHKTNPSSGPCTRHMFGHGFYSLGFLFRISTIWRINLGFWRIDSSLLIFLILDFIQDFDTFGELILDFGELIQV
jgi:hypothetical protein